MIKVMVEAMEARNEHTEIQKEACITVFPLTVDIRAFYH